MQRDVILGIIRHILTTAGGGLVAKGTLDGDEMSQLAGGIVAILGVVWSVLAKRSKSGKGVSDITPLLLLSIIPLLLGCNATLQKDGAYQGDMALYSADRTITGAYDTLHTFVRWEYENRSALARWPEVKAAADHVRENAQLWISSAIALRDAYAATPTPEARDQLATSLRTLRAVLNEAANLLIQYGPDHSPQRR
jgi:hypothetical protein